MHHKHVNMQATLKLKNLENLKIHRSGSQTLLNSFFKELPLPKVLLKFHWNVLTDKPINNHPATYTLTLFADINKKHVKQDLEITHSFVSDNGTVSAVSTAFCVSNSDKRAVSRDSPKIIRENLSKPI